MEHPADTAYTEVQALHKCLASGGQCCTKLHLSIQSRLRTWLSGSNFLFGAEVKPAPRTDVMGRAYVGQAHGRH